MIDICIKLRDKPYAYFIDFGSGFLMFNWQALDVQTFVQNNPQLAFSLILQLAGTHGHQQFDRLTKTKTVESILTAMDEPGIKNYIKHLYSQFNELESTKA
jgi:DNA polymerase phi